MRLPADLVGGAGRLLAAVFLLACKYSDAEGFRLSIQEADNVPRSLSLAMPAGRSVTEHCEAAESELARLASPPRSLGPTSEASSTGRVLSAGPGLEFSFGRSHVHLQCHTHVVDARGADRMLGHFVHLLRQMAAAPSLPLRALRLVTDAEIAVLNGFNDTRRPYDRDSSIYGRFASVAAAEPDRIAISHDAGALTYRELQERAAHLAGRLHDRGVRRHTRVALILDKSPRLLVAVLAVLRLGATYVPIERGTPERRRDFLLADSGAGLLLTEEATTAPVPVLDLAASGEDRVVEVLTDVAVSPLDPAYVMYTSGTTGLPKGVLVNHRAVLRLVLNTDYLDLSDHPTVLQAGAIAFDATTFEYWAALLNGGVVVLVPRSTVLSAAELRVALDRHHVDTMCLTTALFHQLVEEDPGVFGGCQVVIGGEALSAHHVAAALAACPESSFVNGYGPTENTTFSVAHRVTGRPTGRVPIGRPIANSTAYVMDRDGNPQPVGVPGELWVGGDGLSDGYLNRPDLDGQAFVLGGIGVPERLYRTGDRARWTDDGVLDFVGRNDNQVKVRGFRVELGEIERQLMVLPGVREAVVLPSGREGTVSTLSAYFTAGSRLEAANLRQALRQVLPEYMVPSSFMQVESMPLTRTNKIDRTALAAESRARTVSTAHAGSTANGGPGTQVAPVMAAAAELEARVATIMAELLGVAQVSPDDNFFDLGGHSLLAIRLWSRLRSELGVEFELRRIFDTPSVAGLVAVLPQDRPRRRPRPVLARRSS